MAVVVKSEENSDEINENSNEINEDNVSAESRPTNKRKRWSEVWEYFIEESVGAGCTRAFCKQCRQSFAYTNGSKCIGTTNLKKHLSQGTCISRTEGNGVSGSASEHQGSGVIGQIGAGSEMQPVASSSPTPASNQSLAVTQAPVPPYKKQKTSMKEPRSCEANAVSIDELGHSSLSELKTGPVKENDMSVHGVNNSRGMALDIGNLSSCSTAKTEIIESLEVVQTVEKPVEATMKTSFAECPSPSSDVDIIPPLTTSTSVSDQGKILDKTKRKRSVIWEHFTLENASDGCIRAICKQCKGSFAYRNGLKFSGTSHLKRHIAHGTCLLRKDPAVWENFTKKNVSAGCTRAICKQCKRSFAYRNNWKVTGISHLKYHIARGNCLRLREQRNSQNTPRNGVNNGTDENNVSAEPQPSKRRRGKSQNTPKNGVNNEADENNVSAEPQPSKRRKGKKSIVWEHFTVLNVSSGCARALCNQCKGSFAYRNGLTFLGTSHLKRHIAQGTCLGLREGGTSRNKPYTPENGVSGSASNPTPSEHQDFMRSPAPASNQSVDVTQALGHSPLSEPNTMPVPSILLIQESLTNEKENNIPVDSVHGSRGMVLNMRNLSSCSTLKTKTFESLEVVQLVDKPLEATIETSFDKCPNPLAVVDVIPSPTVSTHIPVEEFVFVDKFKIPAEYAVLYKKIYEEHDHMWTKKIISSGTILEAFVTNLLKIISSMEAKRGVELTEELLDEWERVIKEAETVEFNIKWLREEFNRIKNHWRSSLRLEEEIESHSQVVSAMGVIYEALGTRKAELGTQLSEVKIQLSQTAEKRHSQVMSAMGVKYEALGTRKAELETQLSEVKIQLDQTAEKILSDHKAIQDKKTQKINFENEPVLRIEGTSSARHLSQFEKSYINSL